VHDALRQREESLRGRRKEPAGSNDFGLGYALKKVARLHEELHDYKRAEPLWREALPLLKTDENDLADVQASFGRCLLHTGKPAEAEPVLRQCLAIREKKGPDGWETFLIKSLLGTALLEQKKYADAEPLLLASSEGMQNALPAIGAERQSRRIDNAERLVQLYEAMNKKDNADAWRRKLQEVKKAVKTPVKP
jgi:tetratricopeptide (TPR) repeat protein